jgi:diaminohydroxyphosphoribosylaminopyrimidine deaminase/5-amino-6-(5-phosphoribosylamino)uracil reductase
MIGSNTVVVDDPLLTCRLPGLEHESPVRIVLDSRLNVPLTARVVAEAAKVPTWFITLRHGDAARRAAFLSCGVELIEVPPTATHMVDMAAAFQELGRRGLTRVLVEGGSTLAAVLLRGDLVDQLAWFHAPALIGGDGIPAVAGFGLKALADAPRFERIAVEAVGEDVLETLRRA